MRVDVALMKGQNSCICGVELEKCEDLAYKKMCDLIKKIKAHQSKCKTLCIGSTEALGYGNTAGTEAWN